MKRFYSQATGCCYLDGVHKGMPADAVEISDERFDEVIANPAPGKVRSHDKKGLPILIDPPPPTSAERAAKERLWRDAEMARQQWLRDRHRDEQDIGRRPTLTAEQFAELLGYLQALRDWPQSEQFPEIEHRPVAPPWIAEQTQ
ncbi:phage tail assembly chaperone [Pseudomonas muyukensis]|uniref:Phage tail assembly chaperone n=1 Tax=Pseudomonas muyukensis TaxID=2842357 RepID=A0ABX8M1X6_9PSED|nr:phage tail assembly chaperone [Pseudomonas muyukensis]QXH33119.1 phage tail assembly chaperone [Pseudomonas muyukensis]